MTTRLMPASLCCFRRTASLALFLPALLNAQLIPASSGSPSTSAAKDEAVQLSVFTVTEEKDIGYESMQTTAGTRTVQELKNLANSISIINAQLIADTASITIDEMMRWSTSGEDNPEPLNVQVDSRVVLRGVANAYAMRNGWIWYSPMDSYNTEKVEVLRGPNSFLYGEADVGGAQNQVTKRGQFGRAFTKAKVMVGSDDLRRAELDINRPIIKDKLAMRLSLAKSHNDSWMDDVRRDFWGAYLAVSYRPFANTQIHVMAEHAETNSVNSQGLYVDAFSRTATAAIAASNGLVYLPAN